MQNWRRLVFCWVVLFVADDARAQTASIRLRFEYPIAVPRFSMAIGRPMGFPIEDKSLVVEPRSLGLKNVVVSVYTGRGGTDLPADKTPPRTHQIVVTKNHLIQPRVTVVKAGDTLELKNLAARAVNLNFGFFRNPARNIAINPGVVVKYRVPKREIGVSPLDCHFFPWTKGCLVALDHPFAAVSDDQGILEIAGLPIGKPLDFRIFHEMGLIKWVVDKRTGVEKDLNRARFKIEFQPGMNDLGTWIMPQFKS